MGDRGDHEAPLALGGGRGAQRLAQAAGHAAQCLTDLRDLAGAGREGVDLELAAGYAIGVGGESGQRAQHPAAQENEDERERPGERDEAGGERDRPARPRALARDPQLSGDAGQRDAHLAVAAQPLFEVGAPEAGRHEDRFAGERLLGGDGIRVDRLGIGDPVVDGGLGVGRRRPDLRLDTDPPEPVGDPLAARLIGQRCPAQHVLRLREPVLLTPRLPPAHRQPRARADQRRHDDYRRERERQPRVQRARPHRCAGGSKR
jgi:hypothetical protein